MQIRDFNDAVATMPLIVALRGIREEEINNVGNVLVDNGVTIVEITLRTENAAVSSIDKKAVSCIEKMIHTHGRHLHVSAGTVTQVHDLKIIKDLGVSYALSPCMNDEVLREAENLSISFVPGVETFTEAMSAIRYGAKGLKLFPSFYYEPDGRPVTRISPGFVRYLTKFVSCPVFLSGDLSADDLPQSYIEAGATGYNIGSNLYRYNIDLHELDRRAKKYVNFINNERRKY